MGMDNRPCGSYGNYSIVRDQANHGRAVKPNGNRGAGYYFRCSKHCACCTQGCSRIRRTEADIVEDDLWNRLSDLSDEAYISCPGRECSRISPT